MCAPPVSVECLLRLRIDLAMMVAKVKNNDEGKDVDGKLIKWAELI